MGIFKFRWPYKEDPATIENIKYNGQPIGKVIGIENTDEGVIVTGEFSPEFTEGPDYKKLFIEPDRGFYSLGPIPTDQTMQDYAKADIEMTMALYNVKYDDGHGWIKPGTKWGCATVILASIGLWFLVYFIIHWLVTGHPFPILNWS